MELWEVALKKINELVLLKKLKNSPLSSGSVQFFESELGQFALEVPRASRPKKGAKFWFSFRQKVPDGVAFKAPGDGRNNKLNTTPGSRMGDSAACWSILIDDSKKDPRGIIDAILSELSGSRPLVGKEADSEDGNPESGVTYSDQKDLELDTARLNTGEREAVVKVRFGQGAFRSSLLKVDGDVCWMSGIEGKEFLVASHIRPWARCDETPDARGCPDNGLLLSSLWDAAFDSGLVTFDEEWRVIASSVLSESAKRNLGLQEEKFLSVRFRNPRRAQYLAYHREEIFRQ